MAKITRFQQPPEPARLHADVARLVANSTLSPSVERPAGVSVRSDQHVALTEAELNELRADIVEYFMIDPATGRPWGGPCCVRYVRSIDAWYGDCEDCGTELRLEHSYQAGVIGEWLEHLAEPKGADDDAARKLLHDRALPVLRERLGVADLDALDAEGFRRDDEADHASRCTWHNFRQQMRESPELDELQKETRRYGSIIEGPNHLRLIDQRYILDNLMLWEDLWHDLQLHLPTDMFDDFVALFEGRSAGPTLTDTDEDLFLYLDEAAGAWDNDDGLDANPPDPTVSHRHRLIWEGSVVFKGSPAQAVEFLRGVLAGWIRPIARGTDRP